MDGDTHNGWLHDGDHTGKRGMRALLLVVEKAFASSQELECVAIRIPRFEELVKPLRIRRSLEEEDDRLTLLTLLVCLADPMDRLVAVRRVAKG